MSGGWKGTESQNGLFIAVETVTLSSVAELVAFFYLFCDLPVLWLGAVG
ncbi:4635_t:CDS:1, partial [Gigaspora rosea]